MKANKWVTPADHIQWDEPKEKLKEIQNTFKQHYGERVLVWGGGGSGSFYAILNRVTIHPSILRDGKGYSIRASLTLDKPMTYEKTNKWCPWLGSWQVSVKA